MQFFTLHLFLSLFGNNPVCGCSISAVSALNTGYIMHTRGNIALKNNEKFTEKAESAIEQARLAAYSLGHSYVGTEHLLLSMLSQRELPAAAVLSRCGWEAG